jgi:hypothetical protein
MWSRLLALALALLLLPALALADAKEGGALAAFWMPADAPSQKTACRAVYGPMARLR